jgi:hypothetical protein
MWPANKLAGRRRLRGTHIFQSSFEFSGNQQLIASSGKKITRQTDALTHTKIPMVRTEGSDICHKGCVIYITGDSFFKNRIISLKRIGEVAVAL